MTEGQKSLSQFIAFINKHAPNKVDEIAPAISEIKRLVDKATPKKAYLKENTITNLPMEMCPNCDDNIKYGNNYCSECGQAMDWSES